MSARRDARLLAIDQGTTGTTALLLDSAGRVVARGYAELQQHFPRPGLVEHRGEEIWQTVLHAVGVALGRDPAPGSPIAAIGITNQRETTLLWERSTSRPVAPAIVWQDRRTSARCEALRRAGHERAIARQTGLRLDPYFSATKLEWLLDHVPGARAKAEEGRAGLRDRRLVAPLEAHRRPRPRDGSHQREPDAPLRHPPAAMGLKAGRALSNSRRPRCPKSVRPRATSARRSAFRAFPTEFRSAAWPAISRPRSSDKAASRPAASRTPTGRDASSCSTRARRPCPRARVY